MAHVAIDARKYFDFGIGTYIQCLIDALSKLRTSHAFSLYVSPNDAPRIASPDGWRVRTVPYGKYSVAEFLLFSRRAHADGIQIFHEPHYTLPLGMKGKSAVTIHDLIHLRLSHHFSPLQHAYARFMIGYAVRNAGVLITTTNFNKQDIVDIFGANSSRVSVVPLAVRDTFQPVTEARVLDGFRKRHALTKPYILYVGNTKPHKNIPIILQAFKDILEMERNIDLAFVGESVLVNEQLRREIMTLDILNNIHDLGRLPVREVVAAYAAAEMFVFPSEYEGFGLPVLEAMASGTPVIISDAGPLLEVAGGAALVVERGNRESLAHAMHRLLGDSALGEELRDRGRQNVRRFSWDRTAQQTLAAYESLI